MGDDLLRVLLVQHEDMCEVAAMDNVEGLQAGEGGNPHGQNELEPWAGAQVQVLQIFKGWR